MSIVSKDVIPQVESHDSRAGKPMQEDIHLLADDRAEAQIVAQALHAQGWSTEIRQWTRRQRRAQDRLGRWGWRAGYVEMPIDYVAVGAAS